MVATIIVIWTSVVAMIPVALGSSIIAPHCLLASAGGESTGAEDRFAYWQEQLPENSSTNDDETTKVVPDGSRKEKRQRLWSKKDYIYNEAVESHVPRHAAKEKKKQLEPHPMRTNEWRLNLSFGKRQKSYFGDNNLLLDFSEDGYVRVLPSATGERNDESKQGLLRTAVGKWKLHPSGIDWSIPILRRDSSPNEKETVTLYYHADLHLNQFGSQPRMVRGTITRDRKSTRFSSLPKAWFRPVIATFTAQGIGQDTADVSYQERRFGLPSTQ